MAETITVPGIGPVKQPVVIGVAALGAGWVAYAWWAKGRQGPAEETVAPNPDLVPETDRTPVVGDSSGSWDTTGDANTIGTNAEWSRAATEYLVQLNYDAGAVAGALGKFLGHQTLTATEVDIVLAAKGAFGDPPTGGPWPVTAGMPQPTNKAPGPPIDLRVTTRQPGRNVIAWAYDGRDEQITKFNIEATTIAPGITDITTTDTVPAVWRSNTYSWVHLGDAPRGSRVRYTVIAFNRDTRGGEASIETEFV